MCFDCSCDNCGYAFGNVIYIFERLASCCAMTAVVTCLIATLMVMLGMGIGLGYNYCFVDNKFASLKPIDSELDLSAFPPSYRRDTSMNKTSVTTTTTSNGDASLQRIPAGKSFNPGYYDKRNLNSPYIRTIFVNGSETATVSENLEIRPTMVVPLQKVDLLSLIARIRNVNKNVTLELIQ